MLILYSLRIMECHLVALKRAKYISEHLVDRVMIMVKEVRLTDAVLLLTEQVTLYFILYMDRLVYYCTSVISTWSLMSVQASCMIWSSVAGDRFF